MSHRKKLIEVALPLEAINEASAREKSIRHGHPSTLHLWWARRPLAAARAVIFASLVDDPDSPGALPAFVDACKQLPKGVNAAASDTPRMRLFDFIETLVKWESTTDEAILNTARELIQIATEGSPPPLLDPFAGGGSIPLEAQRLGLEAHASDLNPVAVMINKAQIEIPPRFANMPPVNPRDREKMASGEGWRGAAGLAADVRYYGEWMREKAWERIGHLYPTHNGETVIAWLWARTVKSPNPAVNAHVPLVRSFILSKKKGRECWARPVVAPTPSPSPKMREDSTPTPGPSPKMREGMFTASDDPAAKMRADSAPTPSPSPKMREGMFTATDDTTSELREGMFTAADDPAAEMRAGLGSPSLPVGEGAGGWGPQTHTIRFEVTQGKPPKGQDGTYNRSGGTCVISGEPISRDYIKSEAQAGRMGAMLMAIVTEGQNGRSYYSPTDEHRRTAEQAKPEWAPVGELADDPRNIWCKLYGLIDFADLFTPRQLVALTTFSDLVHEARQQAHADALAAGLADDHIPLRAGGRGALAYAEAVSVYLAFGVDRSADFWSNLAFWANQTKNELVAHVFGRQALPMVWDYAEANPFSTSGGNWMGNLTYVAKGIESLRPMSNGFAHQMDARYIYLGEKKIIATDPPYYDNIGYADLSDYFYVWLRKTLRDVYPDIFSTMLVPKEPELIASPYRHGGKEAANEHFEGGMLQTFANIRRFISHDYPLTVYYAFKQQDAVAEAPTPGPSPKMREGEGLRPESLPHEADGTAESLALPVGERAGDRGGSAATSTGWETMLTSLIESGFSIDGTWPIRTERTIGIKGATNMLASSIVLVCRPRVDAAPTISRRAFLDDLRRELPAALREMQSGNIAPVDLAQASIGPGMAIYSRYSQVLEADGSPMSVRTALGLINQALDEYLAEQDGDIDVDTRFAVDWFAQFGFNEGDFGVADVLARAKNTSVEGTARAGVVVTGRGKVRLKHWSEYDPGAWDPTQDKRPTVWEATHHLIERLNSHGETGSAMLMQKMPPDMAAEARQLAYRLYSICERKSWADHARDYNALVISWSGIGEEAVRLREAAARGDATTQMRLFDD